MTSVLPMPDFGGAIHGLFRQVQDASRSGSAFAAGKKDEEMVVDGEWHWHGTFSFIFCS